MAETRMQLADWLDDLCVRFIINLPQEELESVERICFQVEEAQWFYEDFVRPLDPSLPSMNLRQFCLLIFQVCPFLSVYSAEQHLSAYSQFLAYKTRVPVRGAIMLNENMDEVVLVKGWKKGANWSFPRGKINKDEKDLDCAIREVYEETGFDIAAAGLVPDESNTKYIEVTMREQHMQLYVFRGVSMDTPFQARTRKEISKISWWKLASLPGYTKKKQQKYYHEDEGPLSANKLYMVAPFLVPLKKWIAQQRKRDTHLRTNSTTDNYLSAADGQLTDADALAEDEILSDVPQHPMLPTSSSIRAQRPQPTTAEDAAKADVQPELAFAAQMKQLLGINGSSQPVAPLQAQTTYPQPLGEHPNNLLALLHGSSKGPTPSHQVPSAPLDYAVLSPPEPQHPHNHQYPQLATFSNVRPPQDIPFSPTQIQSNGWQQTHHNNVHAGSTTLSNNHVFQTPTGTSGFPMQMRAPQGTFNHPPPGMSAQVSTPLTRLEPPTASSSQHHQLPAPYQRTGDPLVDKQGALSHQPAPSIPAASQLPAPKLSAHAMNLLNAFKSVDKKPSPQAPVANTVISAKPGPMSPFPSATEPPPAPHIGPLRTPDIPKPKPPSRANSLQAFGGLIPSTVSPISRRDSGAPPGETSKRKASAHQDNLLSLFKKSLASKVPSPAPVSQPDSVHVVPPPTMSVVHSQEKALDTILPQQKNEQQPAVFRVSAITVPKILQRPSPAPKPSAIPPEPTVAKVQSASRKEQDTGTVRRKPKSTTHTPAKVDRPQTPSMPTIQILKRPADAVKGSPPPPQTVEKSPVSSSKTNSRPATPRSNKEPMSNGTPSKPFQPQILRRPKQSPILSCPSPAPTQAEAKEPTTNTPDQRRQNLLSLFTGPQQPVTQTVAASPLNTPSSAKQNGPLAGGTTPKLELSRSRINSIASPAFAPSPSRINTITSLSRADTPKGGSQSGSRTPISPADKGFLMGYLESVVKGVPR